MVPKVSKQVGMLVMAGGLVFIIAGWALAQTLPPPRLPPPPVAAPAEPAAGPVDGATESPAAAKKPAIELPAVVMSAKVDRPTARQGETVRLIITIEWNEPAAKTAIPLDFQFPDPPQADGLTLFGNSFRAQTTLAGNTVRVSRVYEYEFQASREIDAVIAPLQITYSAVGSQDKQELTTLPLSVKVTKAPLKWKQAARSPALIIGLALAIIASAAALIMPAIRRRREQAVAEGPTRSVHDLARERLREIERLRMAGEYGEYLHRLSREFTRYLEEGLEIKVRSASAQVLAAAVAGRLGEEWRGRVLELEGLLDKVKFAGYEPGHAQLDRAAQTASDLIGRGEQLSERGPGQDGARIVPTGGK